VEYEWSSGQHPWRVRTCPAPGEHIDLLQPDDAAPASVPIRAEWIAGPGGSIHTLISSPTGGTGARPTVLRLHGGPHAADRDEYSAMRAAWIDAGFVVVQPNYRGSTGYGPRWRNAITGRPGLTELEDVIAVLDWCTATSVTDPARVVIEGYSWGGYLALLAAGLHPGRWAAVIGGLPVADFVAAYDEEAEPLQALDRALFRGTPDDVPELYRRVSPITYTDQITAPVLILAGRNDPRCPMGQIDNFVQAMQRSGRPPSVLWFDAGHGAYETALVEKFVAVNVAFARDALNG
jgi:dipeptidyl aminopeptidase/acylaminoacyl peptidase